MDVESLIRQFQQQQYVASELPGGLDGAAIAELFGEQIRPTGEDAVEVSVTCVCRCRDRAEDLTRKFGEWLAGRGHRLVPVDCEEATRNDQAIACYRIEEVKNR